MEAKGTTMKKTSIAKNYAGFIEPWKIALILSKAKKMHFPQDQHEDIVQELICVVKAFKYDACNLSGANETSALNFLLLGSLSSVRVCDSEPF